MKKYIILTAFLLALSSCASVGVTKLNPAEPKEKNCALEIFSSESEIKKPFEVLCLLDSGTATNAFADKTVAGAIQLAKPEACKCGADAILILNGNTEGMSLTGWGRGTALLKAIRFTHKK